MKTITHDNEYFLSLLELGEEIEEGEMGYTQEHMDALKAAKKIVELEVINEFEDDHLPCLDVRIKFDNCQFDIAFYWLMRGYTGLFYRAENSDKCQCFSY